MTTVKNNHPSGLDQLPKQNDALIGTISSDKNGDGFVDGLTNYRLLSKKGGVDLTHRGRKISHHTSRSWDAVKAIENEVGFTVLLQGNNKKDDRFRVVNANRGGKVNGATRWLNRDQMLESVYGEVFNIDFSDEEEKITYTTWKSTAITSGGNRITKMWTNTIGNGDNHITKTWSSNPVSINEATDINIV